MARSTARVFVIMAMIAVTGALAMLGVLMTPSLVAVVRGHALGMDADHFAVTSCHPGRVEADRTLLCLDQCYRPVLTCDYAVGDVSLRVDSTYLDFPYAFATRTQAEAAGAELLLPPVFYDRADPARAVLSRDVAYDHAWPEALASLACFVTAIGAWVAFARHARRRRPTSELPRARIR